MKTKIIKSLNLLLLLLTIFSCNSDDDGNTANNNIEPETPNIILGNQYWAVVNADHETYRDGTIIPQVTSAAEWDNLTTGAWCYYDNDPSKGKLYNWFAVMGIHDEDPSTPNKEFAPAGWHVPSHSEWNILADYLIANGYNYDGTTTGNKIAKSICSVDGWSFSDTEGAPGTNPSTNNSTGFNAYPSGYREQGVSLQEGFLATFWSSSEVSGNHAWGRYIYNTQPGISSSNLTFKVDGFSVRLLKD